jgi:hypothetical protein
MLTCTKLIQFVLALENDNVVGWDIEESSCDIASGKLDLLHVPENLFAVGVLDGRGEMRLID